MFDSKNSFLPPKVPDRQGHFDPYGGRYIAETLMPALSELEHAYDKARRDRSFRNEFQFYLRNFHGQGKRPTPVAQCLSHEASWRHGPGRRGGQPNSQRRDERSAARLGVPCALDVLPYWLGGGAPSLSDDGARLSVSDRPRGAQADIKEGRQIAGLSACLCRRRQQCDGAFLSLRERSQGQDARCGSSWTWSSHRQAFGVDSGRRSRRPPWQ